MPYTKGKNKSEHSSIFSSFECENCGASFKPFNYYCEYCGSERPYKYPDYENFNDINYTPWMSTTTETRWNYKKE